MPTDQKNKIGVLHGVSFLCANIIGSGLFITPQGIVKEVNSVGLAMLVWVLAAAISVLGACCYIELGTSIRKSGSDIAYMNHVGWYSLAFPFLTTYAFVVVPAVLAIQGQTFADYFFDGLRIEIKDSALEFWAKTGVGFGLIFFLMVMNLFSVKTIVARFQLVATAAKIGSTLTIIAIGGWYLSGRHQTEYLREPFKGSTYIPLALANALLGGMFSYNGWQILNVGAGDIANPKRTMPFSILIGMGIVAILYVATNFSFFVVLGVSDVLNSEAVATTFAQRTMGNAQYLMPFMICILLIGSMNSTIYNGSRFFYAGARQGQLPSFLSITNRKHNSPRPAVFFHCLAAFLLWFVGNASSLLISFSYTIWLQRAVSIVVILYIRFKNIPVHPEPVRMPLLMHVSFLSIISGLVLISAAQNPKGAAMGVGCLVLCYLLYLVLMDRRTLSRFEGYRRFCKTVDEKLTQINERVFNGKVDKATAEEEEAEDEKEAGRIPPLHTPLTKSNSSLQLLDSAELKNGDPLEKPRFRTVISVDNERL